MQRQTLATTLAQHGRRTTRGVAHQALLVSFRSMFFALFFFLFYFLFLRAWRRSIMGRRFSGFTTKVVLSGGGSLGMMRKRAMFGGARVEGRWLGGWGATHVFLFLPQMEEMKYSTCFFSFIVRMFLLCPNCSFRLSELWFSLVRIGFLSIFCNLLSKGWLTGGAFLVHRIAFASRV